ncbi:MAG: bifunctional hydroxymethylpyrimidine kinase/phosphomethylpyrimidine kinase [Acidobacteria bacterium]|nr:MAG: bifunctional hydroxymethylpyrimidine kinase/phosphomethylpyrimidine kinase [Acidobacteriota bacterium]
MEPRKTNLARLLIVAGSDSSGGAGIQADLKTASALGVYGMTAITALTAQNTESVFGIVETDPEFVALQMKVCFEDVGCDSIKTGMLSNSGIIGAVAEEICRHPGIPVVVDPVMISTSGVPLLDPQAVVTLRERLLPLAAVVTPNLHEAGALLGRAIDGLDGMKEAAKVIHSFGAQNVVVKGGHAKGSAVDVFFDGHEFVEFRAARIATNNCHGTGCIFASALASGLAKGNTVRQSVALAKEFVTAAILEGLLLGRGHGPANPMHSRRSLP